MKNIKYLIFFFLIIPIVFFSRHSKSEAMYGGESKYFMKKNALIDKGKNTMSIEKFRNINNVYGKWRVKGCRIIAFEQDEEDLSFHQVKVSKYEEREACMPYVGKEMIITKELLDFDFGKCPAGCKCKIRKENPKFKLNELNLDDKNLPWRYDGQYMLQNQQKVDMQWMVLMDDWEPGDAYEEDYYTFVINYTIFTNYLEIVNFYLGSNLYLVLEKVE